MSSPPILLSLPSAAAVGRSPSAQPRRERGRCVERQRGAWEQSTVGGSLRRAVQTSPRSRSLGIRDPVLEYAYRSRFVPRGTGADREARTAPGL